MNPAGSYATIHSRLRVIFGPASDHLCSTCLERAGDWAYMHDDPAAQADPRGMWSPQVDHYTPMCRPCHKIFDEEVDFVRNREIVLAVATGQTLVEVGRRFGISRQRVHQIVKTA